MKPAHWFVVTGGCAVAACVAYRVGATGYAAAGVGLTVLCLWITYRLTRGYNARIDRRLTQLGYQYCSHDYRSRSPSTRTPTSASR